CPGRARGETGEGERQENRAAAGDEPACERDEAVGREHRRQHEDARADHDAHRQRPAGPEPQRLDRARSFAHAAPWPHAASLARAVSWPGWQVRPPRAQSPHGGGVSAISSLPAWTYTDPRFFELERENVFRSAWQIVGHVNDAPRPGDYVTLDFLGERIVTLRGAEGAVRSFHNVCRHRAAKLAPDSRGSCGHRLVCPYHAWSYGLDGTLAHVPKWQGFETLDYAAHGLKPVEQEIYHGFVFVRLAGGGPSVAEMMAPYEAEIAAYELERLIPNGRVTLRPRRVNWKNVADNYSDGMHIPVAHPGLTRLFGASYAIEARDWVDRMSGELQPTRSDNWSERAYQGLVDALTHMPAERRRKWLYYKLWPNVAFD